MESLVNYDSDDGDAKIRKKGYSREHPIVRSAEHGPFKANSRKRKASDSSNSDEGNTNYENVKMDLSEGSDASGKSFSPKPSARPKPMECDDDRYNKTESIDKRHSRDDTRNDIRQRKDDRDTRNDDRRRNKNYDHRDKDRRSRSRVRDDRDRDRFHDRHHIDRRDRHDERDKYDRRDRDRRDDRGKFDRRERDRNDDHDRIRNDYDRNRDRNRRNDRDKRANSPRYQNDGRRRDRDGPSNHRDDRKDYGKRSYSNTSPSKSHDEKSISPSHRNQSQDESDGNRQKNTSNVDKPSNYRSRSIERRAQDKVQQLQKLGIEIPTIPPELTALPPPIKQLQPLLLTPLTLSSSTITASVPAVAENPNNEPEPTETNLSINLSNFTSPVLVNPRYTEQMQKKKLIWGSKKVQSQQNNGSSNIALPVTNNKWEKAKFSQDSDGKVASKFLRLMGVKNAEAVTKTVESNADDSDADPNVKKREEMFSSMEQQYEMARHATHTMRGVGLGFGSQARPI